MLQMLNYIAPEGHLTENIDENRDQIAGLETALKNLIKLIKAVQYYPPGHPTLRESLHETARAILVLIPGKSEFVCAVRKDGFYLGEKPVGHKNAIVKKLAPYLFARRINHLMFLPGLDTNDLQAFARCLTMEANELQRMGGIHELLVKSRVSTIWVNMIEPAQYLELKRQIEQQKEKIAAEKQQVIEEAHAGGGEPPPETFNEDERSLEKVLRELQVETVDQRFRYLLQELIPHVHLNLTTTARPLILETLNFLADSAEDDTGSLARREHCLHALSELASEDILDYLVSILCSKDSWDALREAVVKTLVSLNGKVVVWRLMDHLAEESDGQVRKSLTEVLIRQGTTAMPVLLEYIQDGRWFVVRNAVAILGEIRREEATEALKNALQHRDGRVRRETIRALTKIGGNNAIGILLRTVSGDDPEMRQQALLSLGAMKVTAAVPTLVKLVVNMPNTPKTLNTKKEALKALGEIGSSDATADLIEILHKRTFWRRRLTDEVRASTAQALAAIGDNAAIAALKQALDDKNEAVSRIAGRALNQLRRND